MSPADDRGELAVLTRNQRYAAQIFEQVSQLPKAQHEKYDSMAHKLPVLVRTAGLAQALAFVESGNSDEQKKLLDHLAEVVGMGNRQTLVKCIRTAELAEYMRLTRNVLAALDWYKRFAQSVLDVDTGGKTEGVGGG
jgi:CRISPR-associated protein Cmr5